MMGKLTVDLRIGESLHVGDAIIQLERKNGQLARLVVTADNHIKIKHKRMSASDLKDTEQYTHGKHTL